MHLIKGFSDCHAPFFHLHLHQGQAIDQNGDIVAVGVDAFLFKLRKDLNFITGNVLFVYEVYVLDMAIIKDKIVDIVIVDFTCFIDDVVAGFI